MKWLRRTAILLKAVNGNVETEIKSCCLWSIATLVAPLRDMYGEVSFLANIDDLDEDDLKLTTPVNNKTHLYQLDLTN